MKKPMVNLYHKFDNPEELPGYGNEHHAHLLISRFGSSATKRELTKKDMEIISNNIGKIMKDPEVAYNYAKNIIEGRWEEAEQYIMKEPKWSYYYAASILRGRWKDVDKPEAEDIIMKAPEWAFYYANDAITGKWVEAEPYIMKDPKWAYHYAVFVLRGRFEAAEPYIMKDAEWAFCYVKDILSHIPSWVNMAGHENGGWPEAERYIKQDEKWWEYYKKQFRVEE